MKANTLGGPFTWAFLVVASNWNSFPKEIHLFPQSLPSGRGWRGFFIIWISLTDPPSFSTNFLFYILLLKMILCLINFFSPWGAQLDRKQDYVHFKYKNLGIQPNVKALVSPRIPSLYVVVLMTSSCCILYVWNMILLNSLWVIFRKVTQREFF